MRDLVPDHARHGHPGAALQQQVDQPVHLRARLVREDLAPQLAAAPALRVERLRAAGAVLDLVEAGFDRGARIDIVHHVRDGELVVLLRLLKDRLERRPLHPGVQLDLVHARLDEHVDHVAPFGRRLHDDHRLRVRGPAAVDQRAAADHARRGGIGTVPALAPVQDGVELAAHVAHRSDAVRQEERRVPLLAVHMHVDQPRHDRAARHVDLRHVRRQFRRGAHGRDPFAADVQRQPVVQLAVQEDSPAGQREFGRHVSPSSRWSPVSTTLADASGANGIVNVHLCAMASGVTARSPARG